jgi:DNA-binding Lrp family transcriptional regulator
LDEIDRKIISQFQQDGRTTLQDLAKTIGYTSMGTKKRLEKLLKNDTIKVAALINPSALKLHPAIVMLEMESAEAMQNLIERFKDCPRVVHIFKTIGGYNLIALVVGENQETLEKHINREMLAEMQQGNTQVRILPHKRHVLFLVPANTRKPSAQRKERHAV